MKTETKPVVLTEKTPTPRWEAYPALAKIHTAMHDMLNELFGVRRTEALVPEGWPPVAFMPTMDMYTKENTLIVECPLPGIHKDEITVTVDGETLTVEGEYKRSAEKKEVLFTETETGSFYRRVRLPFAVKTNEVKAELVDGLLKIAMPAEAPIAEKSVKVPVG